jgi:hypothetical protein
MTIPKLNNIKGAIKDIVETQTVCNEKIIMLPCDKLRIADDQPFRLYTDAQLADLAVRIKQSGLLNPIIVRPAPLFGDKYDVLSGRNRAKRTVSNYIRLTELIPELLTLVDEKKLPLMVSVELSQFEPHEQTCVFNECYKKGKKLSPEQINSLKQLSYNLEFNDESAREIMNARPAKPIVKKQFIKFDKSKFTQFGEIINTSNLEQLFIEFLESRKGAGNES